VVLALLDGIAMGQHVDPDHISLDDAFSELRRVWVLLAASHLLPGMMQSIEETVRQRGATAGS
jgi:hypothetical protein